MRKGALPVAFAHEFTCFVYRAKSGLASPWSDYNHFHSVQFRARHVRRYEEPAAIESAQQLTDGTLERNVHLGSPTDDARSGSQCTPHDQQGHFCAIKEIVLARPLFQPYKILRKGCIYSSGWQYSTRRFVIRSMQSLLLFSSLNASFLLT